MPVISARGGGIPYILVCPCYPNLSMNVPLLDVRRQNLPIEAELSEAFRRVLLSGHFIGGAEVEAFEAAAAAVSGTRFAIGMSSGTDAILVALMALDIGPGDEVICPSFTFDPTQIETLITPRTKAIIPVHLYGQHAEMQPILSIAARHGIAVIEDAAQAFGAQYQGRPAGSMGCF